MPTAADQAFVPGGTTVRIDAATGLAEALFLGLGSNTTSVAEARQSGGILSAEFGFVGWNGFGGDGGRGSFFQTGGTYNVLNTLHIAYTNNSVGTYSISGGALNAAVIALAAPGTNALGTFNLNGAGKVNAGVLTVGNVSTGVVNQDGGTLTLSSDLDMATNGTTSSGIYNLSGGMLIVGGNALVGSSGSGHVLQTSGAASFANALRIGIAGRGDYILNDGSVDVGQEVLLGQIGGSIGELRLNGGTFAAASIGNGAGFGVLHIDGGTLTVGGGNGSIDVDQLLVGDVAGSSGAYTLSGSGGIAVDGVEIIGNHGSGSFVQDGGTHNVGSERLGFFTGSTGTYTLGGTGSLTAAFEQYVGYGGSGTFVQDGGTHTVGHGLILGTLEGSTGKYTLDGSGSLSVALVESVGGAGSGVFVQNGGTHTVGNQLTLGSATGGSGTYTLAGLGSLSVASELVGSLGSGTFDQSGGTHTVRGALTLGFVLGSTGTYRLNGGSLSAASIENGAGAGLLVIDGGTLSVDGGNGNIDVDELRIGDVAGRSGAHTLSGAGGIAVTGIEIIGNHGSGHFTQSGGTNSVGNLFLGRTSGSSGVYVLSGNGSLMVSGGEALGEFGSGSFTQSGGTHSIGGGLELGSNPGGSGAYNLAGTGNLTVAQLEKIGGFGVGRFVQSGGTHHAGSGLLIGYAPTSSGSYDLSGTGTLDVGSEEFIGYIGVGSFSQSGGSHTIAQQLHLGEGVGSNGTYRLTGGALTTKGIADGDGHGTLILDGGTLNVAGGSGSIDVDELRIGDAAGRTGDYALAGPGTITTRNTLIGVDGAGSFTQSGSLFTASTTLTLGAQAGGTGSYRLNGGTLSAASILNGQGSGLLVIDGGLLNLGGGTGAADLDELRLGDVAGRTGSHTLSGGSLLVANEILGNFGGGVFTQTGGTHTVTGVLTLAANSGSQGSYLLGAGSLNAALVDNNDHFKQTGGTFSGVLQNDADFTYIAGSFLGRLVNSGNVTLNTDLVAGNGLENNTSFPVIASGHSVTLHGQGLLNNGEMSLAGGTLTGNGVLSNAGVMSGFGTIAGTAGFVNTASLTQSGGALLLSNTGANQNSGFLDLAVGRTFTLAGAGVTLTNTGTVNLNSGSLNGTGLLANAAGGVVTGRGTISSRFSNAGIFEVLSGTTTVTNGFTNTGGIDLTSAGATLKGGAIANAGVISGRGVVQNAVTNTGTLRPLGGRLTVSGALVNPGTIEVASSSELLVSGGLASNTGTIALAGGRFDNGGHALASTGNVNLSNGTLAGVTALSNASTGVITGQGALETSTLNNAGQLLFSTGSSYIHGSVLNATGGRIVVSGSGGLTFYDLFENQSGGELKVSSLSSATFFGDAILRSGSLLTGDGSKFYEAGLSIGNSPGSAFDAGNVSFGTGNVYEAEIAGLDQGTQFDYLNVGDKLTLGGTLKLTLLDAFAPKLGDSFDLLDFGSVAGAFALFDFGSAALGTGLAWDFSGIGIDGTLRVATAPVPLPAAVWGFGFSLSLLGRVARRRRVYA